MPIAFTVNDRVKQVRAALAYADPKKRALPAVIEDALRLWEAAQQLPSNQPGNAHSSTLEREIVGDLVATATADTLGTAVHDAEARLRYADAADRLRKAGLTDALAYKVDAAITTGLTEIHARLAPALLEHAYKLRQVAAKLPADPFDPVAVLAAKAGPAFDIAQEECAALIAIGAPFAPRPGTVTNVPRSAQPLVAITDVGTVVPQTTVSLGQIDDRGNTPAEAAQYKAVRQMHTDAHQDGTDVAIVRAAAGTYGDRVTFALVHPDNALDRAQQHTNAELVRRGEIDRSQMLALR